MRGAFAAGYAEHGPLPIPRWVMAACEAAASTPGATSRLVEAAGRVEGRRAALQRRRQRIYDTHRGPVMACAKILTDNVHLDDLLRTCTSSVTETSQDQRGQVKAAAAAVLTQTLRHVDGLHSRWQQANADAAVEARAEGQAEAAASTTSGGPADPRRVAALFGAAAAGLATAVAWRTAGEWTTAQVDGLAGDIAQGLTVGADDPTNLTALQAALSDRAGVAYYLEELMHAGYAFGFHIQAQAAGQIAVNFQTVDDDRVCPTCDSYEGANPWTPDSVPQPPIHGGCRCALEYGADVPAADLVPA